MARKIKIVVGSVTAIALLLDDEAPKTCQAIWDKLPMTGSLVHAIVEGREVFLPLTERLLLEPENQTIYPIEGDLSYYYKPINLAQLDIPLTERDVEVVSLVYGPDTQMMGPILPLPVNHFGCLIEGKEELSKEIGRMRREGFGTITISKLEE